MAPSSVSLKPVNRDGNETYANIDWDQLGFAPTPTDYMYVMKSSNKENFSQGHLVRCGNIEISPFAAVLNYGQGLIEGLKAYRREDGRILLFRPDQNAKRMQIGAQRLCLPSLSVEQFVEAIKQTTLANKHWVPPHGKGSLYLRPLLLGSGPVLVPVPAPECTFLIYATPIGNHYLTNRGAANLYMEDKVYRAVPGGIGGIKSINNYSPVFEAVSKAKAKGFSDVLFLDAATGKYIEEVSSCNIFIVKGNVISTPAIQGTVLPGVTRKSIIELALDMGYQVEERNIPVEDLMNADEVFCTGTAVIVTPVGTITSQYESAEYKTGEETVANKLRTMLSGIQMGLIEDKKGWTVVLD
ncbi:branched-chain-amino-acid aminotransferase 2, chloroplastic-like [Durio zibethinus]|uniref:Branched-chain-amino-acid aminotransferase n=1 Tax=Durio zibethinus TaxID=66656 RepID=A0A6P6ABK7_DURZI|nr:branched-chain-amino-acid aminotransferase 2, chloroplastic-like [Durio zibethinus]